MRIQELGRVFAAITLGVGLTLVLSLDADAGWRWHGSSGGSSGSWGGSSSSSYGSSGSWGGYRSVYYGGSSSSSSSSGSYGSYGSYGSSGSSGGLLRRWASHHVSYSSGSSGSYSSGSSGSYVTYGGSSSSSSSSSGSYGSYGSYGGGVTYYGASVATPSSVTIAQAPAADSQNGLLVVNVPENAKVYVNDYLTKSTGAQRQFLSKGLVSGKTYKYAVRVEVEENGETRTETRNVSLTAGNTIQVAFNELQPVETTLAINVPAGAKIVLEGQEMKSTGTIRVFSSTELSKGDAWNNYTVRVELEQDGETLVKEEKIDLAAGDYKELSFDFAQRVATRE